MAVDREYLLKLAFADRLEGLKEDRSASFALLKSSDWKERFGALKLLESFWRIPNDLLLPICDGLVASDPNPQVRAFAISVIGRIFAGTFESERSRLLAQIAVSESNDRALRRAAVRALFIINEEVRSPFEHNNERSPENVVKYWKAKQEELRNIIRLLVDWDYVGSFL